MKKTKMAYGTFIKNEQYTPLTKMINYIFMNQNPTFVRRFDKVTKEQTAEVLEVLNTINPNHGINFTSLHEQLWWNLGAPRTSSDKYRDSYAMRERVYINSL